MFDLEYVSTLNRYFLSYSVSASTDDNGPTITVSWSFDTIRFYANYYPGTGEYYGSDYADAKVSLIDNMIIRNKTYNNILKIAFTQGNKQWLLFFARPQGLIKIIRPDDNYSERE